MFDKEQLALMASCLAMLISVVAIVRQRVTQKDNTQTQERLASLERDLAQKANDLRQQANLTQDRIEKIHELANEIQRQANLTQRRIEELNVSRDELAKTQIQLIRKMELEPYFSSKWKKSSSGLNHFSQELRAWLDRASAHRDNLDFRGPPTFAGVIDYKSIDWSYSPELGMLLPKIELRMDCFAADALEHRKLLKMASSSFWLGHALRNSTPEEDRSMGSLGDPSDPDDDDFGIFGRRVQFEEWMREFFSRIGVLTTQPVSEIVLSPKYQALMNASNQKMSDHLDAAMSLSDELHRAVESNDARFLER